MALLPADHPDRLTLADEVHARPSEPVHSPTRATYVAVLVDPDDRVREHAHLAALCTRHAVAGPAPGVTQFSAALGVLRVKWERHGEFSGYTFFAAGAGNGDAAGVVSSVGGGVGGGVGSGVGSAAGSSLFDSAGPTTRLPPGWLAKVPGVTVAAVHAELVQAGDDLPDAAALSPHFDGHAAVGAEVGDGAGVVFTDFRIHADGCTRFLVLDRSFTPRQAGRMLQRLFEIEAYRMLALLALPIARRQSPRIVTIEKALAALTDDIASDKNIEAAGSQASDDEALLHQLTRLAAEVESGLAASQFRFGACRAYFELVTRRIAELREARLPGVQTIEEFMARRFTPAVATCATVSQRLHDLSERVSQASALLSTRVEIARERQNQSLLGSMDRRAKVQLRLQQTVEGLSVAAIVYYVAGLAGYGAKALKAGGLPIEPDLLVGLVIPVIAVGVLLALRRARRRLARDEGSAAQESG